MNRSLAAAWLAGEAIVIWRMVHRDHRPPVPGALLGITALFLAMGVVAEIVPRAAPVIGLAAWGLDIAALLQVLPAGLSGQITQAEQATANAQGTPGPNTAGEGTLGPVVA